MSVYQRIVCPMGGYALANVALSQISNDIATGVPHMIAILAVCQYRNEPSS